MRISGTIKWLGIAATSLGVLLVVVGFLLVWLNQQGEALKSAMQTIANEQALIEDRTRLTAVLAATEAERAELASYVLIGDDGAVALLSLIDEVAAELSVELSTSNLRVEAQPGNFNDLVLEMALVGSGQNVKQLVSLLERLPYHSEVTDLRLDRSVNPTTGTDTMNGSISLRVTLVSYDQ